MREIKFRGMRNDNHQWVYGHYYEEAAPLQPIGKQEPGTPYIVFPAFADWNMPREMLRATVIPETIGQFTGLLDKNSKEVYEGDIINMRPPVVIRPGFVAYNEGHCAYMIANEAWRDALKLGCYCDIEYEVIGNIYEHPELLEVGQ